MGDLIRYYKVDKLLWRWTKCSGAEGCSIVRDVSLLSMDKAPPPLRDQPKPTARPKPPARKLTEKDRMYNALDGMLTMAEGIARFKKWLDMPDPPKQPKPEPVEREKQKTIPPFDIQEIPGAMRKMFMPVSAKLMEKWFAGQLNYSPDDKAEQVMLNQDGKPYPPSMIDKSTIKMDWILRYARAKAQFENLINTFIYSERDRSNTTATVTQIVVHVKDNYTFGTTPGEPSQYLGHWNKSGVVIVPEFMAADAASWRWLDYPILKGDMPADLFKKNAVFYPVRNKTFREWQLKHNQGGDFVIYTDYKPIRLNPPIKVYL